MIPGLLCCIKPCLLQEASMRGYFFTADAVLTLIVAFQAGDYLDGEDQEASQVAVHDRHHS